MIRSEYKIRLFCCRPFCNLLHLLDRVKGFERNPSVGFFSVIEEDSLFVRNGFKQTTPVDIGVTIFAVDGNALGSEGVDHGLPMAGESA